MHDIINQARELLTARLYRYESLGSPKEAESYLSLQLGDREHEIFAVIFLASQNREIQYREMFHGTIASTTLYPREIARLTLLRSSAPITILSAIPNRQRLTELLLIG